MLQRRWWCKQILERGRDEEEEAERDKKREEGIGIGSDEEDWSLFIYPPTLDLFRPYAYVQYKPTLLQKLKDL